MPLSTGIDLKFELCTPNSLGDTVVLVKDVLVNFCINFAAVIFWIIFSLQ